MRNIYASIWKWAAVFLAGILAGLIAAIRLLDKSKITNIQTGIYVAGLEQRIGKLKQRGEGNVQETVLIPQFPQTRKEKRLARRAERRERILNEETENEESEQKSF